MFKKSLLLFTFFLLSTTFAEAESNFDILFGQKEKYKNVLVTKVYAADYFQIEGGEKIKMIGIKAPKAPQKEKESNPNSGYDTRIRQPETIDPNTYSPMEIIEKQALEYTKKLIENKRVRLEFDSEKKTDDFKTLAYVYTAESNLFVNKELLRQGLADLSISPPNIKYSKILRKAYQESRTEQRGLQGLY